MAKNNNPRKGQKYYGVFVTDQVAQHILRRRQELGLLNFKGYFMHLVEQDGYKISAVDV